MEVDRFHELNAFIAVVEAGGFTAAARRTGDSQSAISKAIGALEKRLGVALFNRNTRSVTLTDGSVYAPPPPSNGGTSGGGGGGAQSYTVRAGDTLAVIAQKYNINVWTLASYNGIYNIDRIYVGQRLLIP